MSHDHAFDNGGQVVDISASGEFRRVALAMRQNASIEMSNVTLLGNAKQATMSFFGNVVRWMERRVVCATSSGRRGGSC
jgi:hypothetical protein